MPLLRMMKTLKFRFILIAFLAVASAADSAWQPARIVDVTKRTDDTNTVWVVNTPITQERVEYTVTAHLGDRIISASYEESDKRPAPPSSWLRDRAVQAQVAGDYLYLRSTPSDEMRGRITKNKKASTMRRWTPEEANEITSAFTIQPPEEVQPMIGFDTTAESSRPTNPALAQATEPPPPPQPTTGTVTLRSMPFLSEIFVDGTSMGYTPARLSMPPGNHTFRCEKPGYQPWSKMITITVGSEQTLDATLAVKK